MLTQGTILDLNEVLPLYKMYKFLVHVTCNNFDIVIYVHVHVFFEITFWSQGLAPARKQNDRSTYNYVPGSNFFLAGARPWFWWPHVNSNISLLHYGGVFCHHLSDNYVDLSDLCWLFRSLCHLVRSLCRFVRSLCWLVNYLCRFVSSLRRLVRKVSSQLVDKNLIFLSC